MHISRRSLLKAIPGTMIIAGMSGAHYWLYPLAEQRMYKARDLARMAEHFLVPEQPIEPQNILDDSIISNALGHLNNLRHEWQIVKMAEKYFSGPFQFYPKPGFRTLDSLTTLYLPARCKPAFVLQKNQPLQEMEITIDYGRWLNWLGVLEPTMKVKETPHPVEIERFCYNGHLDLHITDRADDIHELRLLYDSKPGEKIQVDGKRGSREISDLLNEQIKGHKPFRTIGLYAADRRGNAAAVVGMA